MPPKRHRTAALAAATASAALRARRRPRAASPAFDSPPFLRSPRALALAARGHRDAGLCFSIFGAHLGESRRALFRRHCPPGSCRRRPWPWPLCIFVCCSAPSPEPCRAPCRRQPWPLAALLRTGRGHPVHASAAGPSAAAGIPPTAGVRRRRPAIPPPTAAERHHHAGHRDHRRGFFALASAVAMHLSILLGLGAQARRAVAACRPRRSRRTSWRDRRRRRSRWPCRSWS